MFELMAARGRYTMCIGAYVRAGGRERTYVCERAYVTDCVLSVNTKKPTHVEAHRWVRCLTLRGLVMCSIMPRAYV